MLLTTIHFKILANMSTFSKILLFITTAISSFYFLIFHTSLPFQLVTAFIGQSELNFDDVSGSIESGIHIGKMETEDKKFIVRNFDLEFNGIRDVWETRELRISKFTIDQFYYVEDPSDDKNEPTTKKTKPTDNADKKTADKSPDWFKFISIDLIRIANVHLKFKTTATPFTVDEFKVTQFHSEDPHFFKTLSFKGNYGSLSFEPDQKGSGVTFSFKALPSLFKVLKKDVLGMGRILVENGRIQKLSFDGFDGKLKANLIKNDLVINVQNLDLSEYYNQDYAISRFNGDLIWAEFQKLGFEDVVTQNFSINVGATNFPFENKKLFTLENPGPDEVLRFEAFHSPELFLTFSFIGKYSSKTDVGKKFFKASIVSLPPEDEKSLIARVYFQKAVDQLTASENVSIESMVNFFE